MYSQNTIYTQRRKLSLISFESWFLWHMKGPLFLCHGLFLFCLYDAPEVAGTVATTTSIYE